MMEKINEYRVIFLVAIVAFAVGFGASSLLNSGTSSGRQGGEDGMLGGLETDTIPPPPSGTDGSSQSASVGDAILGDNAVSMESQKAGMMAVVKTVMLKEAGWVAVQEDTKGVPGEIVFGATWLPAGAHNNVKIELLRPLEQAKSYYAVLRGDGKSDKRFSRQDDLPLKAGDAVIMTKFTAESATQ